MSLKKQKNRRLLPFTLTTSLLIGGLCNDGTLQAKIMAAGGINMEEVAPGATDTHKMLCQIANANRQQGKNTLTFMDLDGKIHIISSGNKSASRIFKGNKEEINKYITFIKDIIPEEQFKQHTRHHGLNDFLHTEMLLAYAIAENLPIDGVPCRQLTQRDIHIFSYKDVCPNCEKVLLWLSLRYPDIKIVISSLMPYELNGQMSRNENEQFKDLKIGNNLLKIALYDTPDLPLGLADLADFWETVVEVEVK
ncbi:MAG: hypothetical protein LBD60_03705 [Puniceicoccales bacterium]|jgi:hypothetical protein|nr:hypothetical protein [Puniceicoccales bacterium]